MSIEQSVLARQILIEKSNPTEIDQIVNSKGRKELYEYCSIILTKAIYEQSLNIEQNIFDYTISVFCDEILGFGIIQEIMDDDEITDIFINGPERVFVEKKGKISLTPLRYVNDQHLIDFAQRLVAKVGRRIDEVQPLVDSRLPDGSRINVVIPPIAIDGASISIRKFSKSRITFKEMIEYGSMSANMANFLVMAAMARLNIIISGGTGSGKTTLLNALSQFISPGERIVTIEDAAELKLQQEHVVRLETRPPSLEGTNEITIRRLLINSLRMRPDRIIIGECRGNEAFEMLQAMNTGHDGSMSTVHANSPKEAISRLENMALTAEVGLPALSVRKNIVSAVDLIIQITRCNDGVRRILSITEVIGMEGEIPVLHEIFKWEHKQATHHSGVSYIDAHLNQQSAMNSYYAYGINVDSQVSEKIINAGYREELLQAVAKTDSLII